MGDQPGGRPPPTHHAGRRRARRRQPQDRLPGRQRRGGRLGGARRAGQGRGRRQREEQTRTAGRRQGKVGHRSRGHSGRATPIAFGRGVMVFSASVDENQQHEHELVKALTAHRVDGLIIAPAGGDQGYLEPERRAGTVIVCGPRRGEPRRRLGRRDERQRGGPGVADGAMTTLLTRPDPPTAVFTAQNLVTIGTIKALRRPNRQHRVALVGFDDVELADLVVPGITVVAQDPAAVGRMAASVLFSRLAGNSSPPARPFSPARQCPRARRAPR